MFRTVALRALPVLLALTPLSAAGSIGSATAALPAAPSPAASAPAAAPTVQARIDHAKFRLEFDAAVKLNSKSKMDRLMEKKQTEAIFAIIETADAISNSPNDVLYNRFSALRDTWYRLYTNDFPDQLELYFVNLTPGEKKARRRVKIKYDKLGAPRIAAEQARDLPGLLAISLQYERIADQFQTMGDQWFESDARVAAAHVADEHFHKNKTDYQRVATLYERAIELRNELGVKDFTYRSVFPRMKSLVGQGFGSGKKEPEEIVTGTPNTSPEPGEVDEVDEPKPLDPAYEPVTASMTYEELDALKDRLRPNYYLDEHRQIWPSLGLGEVGDTKPIPRLGGISPTIMRLSIGKVGIDFDKDGESDMDWPTRGKLDTISFEIGEGDEKRMWGVQVETGRTEDFYQGQTNNLAGTKSNINLYYMPGGSMVGDLAGVSIQLYDDNLDGVYGSAPSTWAYPELRAKTIQPELDSIRLDGEKKARPMSEHVDIPGAGWHKLEVLNAGNQVKATPTRFKTGTLQLKTKGIKPDFVIMKGSGAVLARTMVDISGGKKIPVPAGRWTLYFGLLRQGNKLQLQKAAILPSPASPGYDVKEGENVVVTLGAPFAFDFDVTKQEETATVVGLSIQVIGNGGEAYDRFYGAVPRPEASIRKVGSKRGYATEKMYPGESQGDIAKYGWHQLWKPISESFATKGEEVQIQLIEKKNKLFGTIESDWL